MVKTEVKVNKALARKVLKIVDAGLVKGKGEPVPGQMCVEAAVNFAMGLPHNDNPPCVSSALRSLKIRLNDAAWPSNEDRAKGMRKLAILQLGTKDFLNDKEFVRRVVIMTVRDIVSETLSIAASKNKNEKYKKALEDAATVCVSVVTFEEAKIAVNKGKSAAYAADVADVAAYAAAYAAYAAAYAAKSKIPNILFKFAEKVADILIDMKVPAVKWLDILDEK